MASVKKQEARIIVIDDDCDCDKHGRRHRHPHRDHHHHHDRHHDDHHPDHNDHCRKPACMKNITILSVEENRTKTKRVKRVQYGTPWCCQQF